MPRTSSSVSTSRSSPTTKVTPFHNPMSSVGTYNSTSRPSPSLGQSVKDGFGLGVGSAIGQRMISSLFGAPTVNVNSSQQSSSVNPCDKERLAFESCMKTQSMETFCGQQQLAYTECIRLTK